MENEKYFYPTPESNEQPAREYSFNFLSYAHPEAEQAKRTYDTDTLVGMLNDWWKQICDANNINPNDKKLKNIDYFMMELGKNALEHADGGEIKIIFEAHGITVAVSDQGQGFKNLDDIEHFSSAQYCHGLYEVRKYADEFSVETGGKKYAKAKYKRRLIEIGTSDITRGSKITFMKNFY